MSCKGKKKNLHTPVSPTANTKGNKRSRTRTDSYTAGQSVGESTVCIHTVTAAWFVLNNIIKCLIRGLCVFSAEALEGIDLGETTHKKPGTTVPESIHSFSELPADFSSQGLFLDM